MEVAHRKLCLLGYYSALALQKAWIMLWHEEGDPELDMAGSLLEEAAEGIRVLSNSLQLDFEPRYLFESDQFDINRPVSTLVKTLLRPGNPLDARVERAYGRDAAFCVSYAQAAIIASSAIDVIHGVSLEGGPDAAVGPMKEHVASDLQAAEDYLTAYPGLLQTFQARARKVLGEDVCNAASEVLSSINRTTKDGRASGAKEAVTSLIVTLVPEYEGLAERKDRGDALLARLGSCKVGRASWREYEDICIDALKFIFIPTFRRVLIQPRTESGLDRRDAILPNNHYSGFWSVLRQEFESRHVVCEFKNSRRPGKTALNQLRIYLGRPTIGRFGLLFLRSKPSASLLSARRVAYEDLRMLILLIDDEALTKMIRARIYLGDADEVLEDDKIAFDVNF